MNHDGTWRGHLGVNNLGVNIFANNISRRIRWSDRAYQSQITSTVPALDCHLLCVNSARACTVSRENGPKRELSIHMPYMHDDGLGRAERRDS
jgi:hypothetical protein